MAPVSLERSRPYENGAVRPRGLFGGQCASNVATHVATQADSGVTQRSLAASRPGCSEPKRTLAAHPEPSATTVRDREAPGSNPGPPTNF
jgi:hypothetical protein